MRLPVAIAYYEVWIPPRVCGRVPAFLIHGVTALLTIVVGGQTCVGIYACTRGSALSCYDSAWLGTMTLWRQ